MSTVLRMKFGTMSGVKTWNFRRVDPQAETSDIKTLMDTMITNGSIYKYPPLTKDSATLVTTTETDIDIS